jgi:hypothetical protein
MEVAPAMAGALTGFVVGLTGVGGGALMTPILLLIFGTPPMIAVGTDLWFAAITKVAIAGWHQRQGLIDWQVVRRLWLGSLTASALTLVWMRTQPTAAGSVLTAAIGVAVCVSAGGLLAQQRLRAFAADLDQRSLGGIRRWQIPVTVLSGVMLGVLVTVTSVGAGALGAICLLYLYPSRLTPPRLIATDVAHAIPLALFAGVGHLAIGNVNGALLVNLLVGSLPAAMAGAALSARLPHAWLRGALATVLLVIGVRLLYS